jgi:uncharacterized protein (UPF0548 family)
VRLTVASKLPDLIARYAGAPFTYAEVGATLDGAMPPGYHHLLREAPLGTGRDAFMRASNALMRWDMHRGSHLRVAGLGPAAQGETVLLGLAALGVALVVPCRVVYVIDEPSRQGFGYGTLPGHPEQGEESFVVSLAPDDRVGLTITAFSRPGHPLIRAAGPVGRAVQSRMTTSYQRALQRVLAS